MAKKKILLIDDQRYFLLFTKEILEDAGYEVLLTEDVEEGVQLFYEKKPDAVLMDIIMPKEFGTEVCRDLKQTEQGQNTPIILVSSGVKEMSEGDGLIEYNADEYLLKPLDTNILLAILGKHFNLPTKDTQSNIVTQKEVLSTEGLEGLAEKPKPKVSNFQTQKMTGEPIIFEQKEGILTVLIDVKESTRNIFMGNTMINIKNGGVFIPTDKPAALGTKMMLTLKCGNENFNMKGMIIWVQPPNLRSSQQGGMGIRFQDLESQEFSKLKEFVFEMRG